ncbi:hypothetical protein V8C86DRAFT_3031638 [Haematococcus lacustris]
MSFVPQMQVVMVNGDLPAPPIWPACDFSSDAEMAETLPTLANFATFTKDFQPWTPADHAAFAASVMNPPRDLSYWQAYTATTKLAVVTMGTPTSPDFTDLVTLTIYGLQQDPSPEQVELAEQTRLAAYIAWEQAAGGLASPVRTSEGPHAAPPTAETVAKLDGADEDKELEEARAAADIAMQGVEATPPKSGGRRAPTQKQAAPSTSEAKRLGRGKAPKPEKKADAPSDVLERTVTSQLKTWTNEIVRSTWMRCHDLSKVETGGEALFPIQGLQHAEIVSPSNTDPNLAWPACRKVCLGKMIRKLLEVFGHLPPPYDQLSVLTSVLNKAVSTLKDTRHRMTSWTDQVQKETQMWATTLGAFYKVHGSKGVLTEWKDLLVQVDSLESTGRLAHPLPGDWTVACPPQSLIRMVTEAGERLVEDVAQDHGITAIKASQEVYHHMDHVNEAIRAQVSDIMAKARADIAAKLRETPAPPGPGLEAQLQQAAGAAGGGQEANPGINLELQ